MSITKEITIWCDYPDCPKWVQEPGSIASALRRDVCRRGWTYKNGRDYCRDHAKKKPEE